MPAKEPPSSFGDIVKNMGWRDTAAMGTRVAGGFLSNLGWLVPVPVVNALAAGTIGGASEAIAQGIQGGPWQPRAMASSFALGMVPGGGGASVGKAMVKGALYGAGTTAADTMIREGRLPTKAEWTLGTALNTGGGALGVLGARAFNRAGKTPMPKPGAQPRILTGADQYQMPPTAASAPWTPPPSSRIQIAQDVQRDRFAELEALLAGEQKPPRVLTGADQYRTGTDLPFDAPSLASQRRPYIDPSFADQRVADPTLARNKPFRSELDDATQDPLAVLEDFLRSSDDVSVSRPFGPPTGQVPGVSPAPSRVGGQTALMERMRETADMGQAPFARAGEPEVLPPFRPGNERFTKQAGTVGRPTPGADMTPDDMAAELLGMPKARSAAPQALEPPPMTRAQDVAESVSELPAAQQAAVVRQFSELNPEEGRELRRILAEMNEFRFERGMGAEDFETATGERIDRRQGWRGGLVQHTAGAPVHHDIMGGTKGTRQSVIGALERFINQGKRPSPIAQRAMDVARRRLAGDTELSRPSLPPDAGDVRPAPSWDDELVARGVEPVSPPGIPDEVAAFHAKLRPSLQATNDSLRAAGVPEGIIGDLEEVGPFARRLGSVDRNDPAAMRELMGAERKLVRDLPDDKFEMLRRLLTDEQGNINPELARDLGAAAAGAVAFPLIPGEDNDRASAFGGAALGFLGSRGARNPKLLEAVRSSGLFSGMAQLNSLLGGFGGMGTYAATNPKLAPELGRQLFNRKTVDALKEGWRNPSVREGDLPTSKFLSYPIRGLSAPDNAVRDVINRTELTRTGSRPMSKVPPEDVGGYYGASGEPYSELGTDTMRMVRKHPALRVLSPVFKLPINLAERALEHIPFIGRLPTVRGWTGASDDLVRRRQSLGALAILGAGGAGASAALTDADRNPRLERAAMSLMGPLALPSQVAFSGTRALFKDTNRKGTVDPLGALGAILKEAEGSLPLGGGYTKRPADYMKWLTPYGKGAELFKPDLEFETGDSIFSPAIEQFPFLNEALLKRKPKALPRLARPRVQFRPPTR